MGIQINLDGLNVKMTNVPSEEGLSKQPIYYVYEWFIKDTGQIFYVGKGKGSRYKSMERRNDLFRKVKENFECDVQFVKERLTEYDALLLEEEWMQKRVDEGNVLTNVVVFGQSVYEHLEYRYFETPKIQASLVDKAYFGKQDIQYEEVNWEGLMKTHIPNHSMYGLGPLYVRGVEQNFPESMYESTIRFAMEESKLKIEKMGGMVYKSPAKSIKSIILYGNATLDSYEIYKQKGYEVYHLIDVIKFLDKK